jgi:hypothetical protein
LLLALSLVRVHLVAIDAKDESSSRLRTATRRHADKISVAADLQRLRVSCSVRRSNSTSWAFSVIASTTVKKLAARPPSNHQAHRLEGRSTTDRHSSHASRPGPKTKAALGRARKTSRNARNDCVSIESSQDDKLIHGKSEREHNARMTNESKRHA